MNLRNSLRGWLVRHRDQTAVSYNRFGRPGEEEDDKPPPTSIYVAPFNENSTEFLLFNSYHVQKAAVNCACFGLSIVVLMFIVSFFEFDWYHHKKGIDIGALIFLFVYLTVGVLLHYYVLVGIKKQKSYYLMPFIVAYSTICSFELFFCLILIFKVLEPNVGPEVSEQHPPFIAMFFMFVVFLLVQSGMLAIVLRCRQFLSQKELHEIELKVAEKSRTEYPSIQIIVANPANGVSPPSQQASPAQNSNGSGIGQSNGTQNGEPIGQMGIRIANDHIV